MVTNIGAEIAALRLGFGARAAVFCRTAAFYSVFLFYLLVLHPAGIVVVVEINSAYVCLPMRKIVSVFAVHTEYALLQRIVLRNSVLLQLRAVHVKQRHDNEPLFAEQIFGVGSVYSPFHRMRLAKLVKKPFP